jgi:hypothetical protein
LMAIITVKNCAANLAFVSVAIMTNNSVYDCNLGVVNGFGQSKLLRCIRCIYVHGYEYA